MGCGSSKPDATVNGASAKPSVAASGKSASTAENTVLGKPLADVTETYNLGKVLGKGQFGTTRLASDKKGGSKVLYACKSISKRKLKHPDDIDDVRREIQIMHHLKGHPNVTYLQGSFEDRQAVHLVMDLCSGGELFDRIVDRGTYSEKDAAALIRTIVGVVAHCHNMGVIHRDLKPENFLLDTKAENAVLKCTDFGLSVYFKPGEKFRDVVGSAYYVAPEVLKRNYGPEADIWSCGVILYILLSGVPPFWGETEDEVFKSIVKGKLDLYSDPWPSISAEAKDCVRKMLEMDPAKRATADQILQHPWMRENGVATDKPLDNVILQRMKTFANHNKLKKEAMKVIASAMPSDEIAGLANMFKAIDADGSGTITADELREALKQKGSLLKPDELQGLLAMIDMDKNGTIDYAEFIAATMSQHQMNKEENLMAAFRHFDTDGSGTISRQELKEALQSTSVSVDKEIDQILDEVDKDGNGEIDYEEFCTMMCRVAQPAVKGRGGLNAYKAAKVSGFD